MSTIHCCFQYKSALGEDVITKMLAASDYWNPDATSLAGNTTGTCCLAKASLFNTKLSKSDNVFTDEQTGSIISANARIDNRIELFRKLNIGNHDIPDGELILRSYFKWGRECPKYLYGDFAFIIWDEEKQKVYCARDHFGVKVLLYAREDIGIMLSNEPNSFFTSGWLKKEIKESWLVKHLWGLGLNSEPFETAYEGLDIVPAAHYMEIDSNGTVIIKSYWKLADNRQWQNMSDEDLLSEFERRFRHAVEMRMESDYPLAFQLSEGLDSNGIAGIGATMKPDVPIYTLSYDCVELTDKTRPVWGKTYEDISEMLNMHDNLHPIWTSRCEPNDDKDKLTAYIAGTFALRRYWLWHCRLAHQKGARVLMSGWGGDHCVSTYGDFYEDELFNALKFRQVHKLFKDKQKRGSGRNPYKAWMFLLMKHFVPPLSWWYNRISPCLEHSLWQRSGYSVLKKEYIKRYRLKASLKAYINGYSNFYSIKAHHRRELFYVGVERQLIDSELCARMFRLEFRFPMFDVPLVEFAYNLPSSLKIRNGVERYAFRQIIKGVVTERTGGRLKSDVNQPHRDIVALSVDEKREIHELLQSPFIRKYCSKEPFDMQNDVSEFMARLFCFSAPAFRYFADNNIPVKETRKS
ncbi:MAG: asparagine synthase-related protein [Bacteroidales bacterium]|jgi:asparagine synthase (glutamine-hydrolysing)|nr:asparagine synthase-related protein [Bacteroidales bacterium]MCI1784907.1 asparagine synthase-related protein [Bacteroidales bacterium]